LTRRVHLDNLRSSDPVTLEIVVQEALRRPLVQLSAETIADMVALAEVESLPKALKRAFAGFADRTAPEIADLPSGEPIGEFLEELEAVDPAKVPRKLREVMAAEGQGLRLLVERERILNLVARWSDTPPEPVVLGQGRGPVIHRMRTAQAPVEPKAKPTPRGDRSDEPVKKAKPVPRPKLVDEDRHKWITDLLLDRLADYLEQGLREDVLIAGVRHRARAEYPDITAPEITGILRELQDASRVRHAAGRWRRVLGSW
jgi:hypothetical protein